MPAKILIVDDNPQVLRLLKIFLSKAGKGYEIISAGNGEEAYNLALKENPDLIISDVMMPQMDGIEFCMLIRENSPIPTVPFIFLTSFEDQETELRGFRAGADDYLTKPVDRKQLLTRVDELLKRKMNLEQVQSTTKQNKGFAGDLKELSIVELVQMLNLNKKSGLLKISGAVNGDIYLKEGHLWAVFANNKTGEEAFLELVALVEGTFQFEVREHDEIVVDRNIQNSTMNVIMEACRIMDETRLGHDEQ